MTTSLGLAAQYGPEAAETITAYHRAHIHALKKTVDEEKLDCEFELRRSFDVFCNEAEAKAACDSYVASRKAGHAWTEQVDILDSRHIEHVSSNEL